MGAKDSEKAVHLFLPVKTGEKSGPAMGQEQRLHHTKRRLRELAFTVSVLRCLFLISQRLKADSVERL